MATRTCALACSARRSSTPTAASAAAPMIRITHGSHLFVPETGANTAFLLAAKFSRQPVDPTGCEVRSTAPLGLPPVVAMIPPWSSTICELLAAFVETWCSVPPRNALSRFGSVPVSCTRVPSLALNGRAV